MNYINDVFKQVKKDLIANVKVLFIGTPCQVSGLKAFLNMEYDNLTTVDIICHGVPSQKLLFDEIISHGIDLKIVNYVSFRDKNGYNFKLIDNKNNVLLEKNSSDIPYFTNFLQGNIFRENCYSCKYARKERISDLTIGDFWGLDKKSSIYDDESKGISVILVNTEKGKTLLNKVKDECILEERTLEEASKFNVQLNHPMDKSKKYYKYIETYPLKGYKATMKSLKTLKESIKGVLKRNKLLYKIYKIIK